MVEVYLKPPSLTLIDSIAPISFVTARRAASVPVVVDIDTVGSFVCNYEGFDIKFSQFDYRCNNFVEFRELSHPQLDGTVDVRPSEML